MLRSLYQKAVKAYSLFNHFRLHTKEKTGVLRAERLRDAHLEAEDWDCSEILSIIILRYMRKDGTLRFGDFIAIILNLTVAFGM